MSIELIKQRWFNVDDIIDRIDKLSVKYGLKLTEKVYIDIIEYYFGVNSNLEYNIKRLSRYNKLKKII